MAKRKHHPGHNLGDYLHPKKGSKTMAKAPAMSAASAPADDGMDDGPDDQAAAGGSGGSDSGDESGQVLLTVLKNDDGTYTLIEGDEDDGGESSDMGSDGNESDMGGGSSGGSEGQQFDSKGALLKGILDILNEDESSEGEDGSSDDQFAAGYNENAPQQPAMPQKY